MRVVITGASGLIGSALSKSLRRDAVEVTRLVRREPREPDEREWDPAQGLIPLDAIEGADALVNLSGASIGHLPWTRGYRSELLWSRLTPTRVLAGALVELGADAPRFVSASAVGFYGSAPECTLTESAPRGSGFLASLCGHWEAAARRAADTTAVALLRTAPVLHLDGVLRPLIQLTRLGLSGPLGRGNQVWPWISLEDAVRAIRHVIDHGIEGPVNLTGPTRATANDIGFSLAQRVNRPYIVRAPAWGLRAALGRQFADGVLLSDAHVEPRVLTDSGFGFDHTTVDQAIADVIPSPDEPG